MKKMLIALKEKDKQDNKTTSYLAKAAEQRLLSRGYLCQRLIGSTVGMSITFPTHALWPHPYSLLTKHMCDVLLALLTCSLLDFKIQTNALID